jgi:hypothetical protein
MELHLQSIPVFCMVSFSLTFMIKDSKIFSPIRKWLSRKSKCDSCEGETESLRSLFFSKLFECSFCTGTWVGLALSAVIAGLNPPANELAILEIVIIYSMLSAFSSYVLDLLTQKLETWAIDDSPQQ